MEDNRNYALDCGVRCKQIRMSKGMSQKELADKMNVSPQLVSKWENSGISNYDTIIRLSNILGQDITSDQINQDSSVSEIGKEILRNIVNGKGYIDYKDLLPKLFGMRKERINNEIFKLERIGAVVREQFSDFSDSERDGIFITAKGLIIFKNHTHVEDENELMDITTLDSILGNNENTFQDVVDNDEITKLLVNLEPENSYMGDYLKWLYANHMHIYIPHPQLKKNIICDDELSKLFVGESCFIDFLYRMLQGGFFSSIDETNHIIESKKAYDNFIEELNDFFGMDEYTWKAQAYFSRLIEGLDNYGISNFNEARNLLLKLYADAIEEAAHKGKLDSTYDLRKFAEKIYEAANSNDSFQQDEYYKALSMVFPDNSKSMEHLESLFYSGMDYCALGTDYQNFIHIPRDIDKRKNCLFWFDDETIDAEISFNETILDGEAHAKLYTTLQRIWELNPSTLDYFYQFPKSWEEKGFAKMLRERFEIPEREDTTVSEEAAG